MRGAKSLYRTVMEFCIAIDIRDIIALANFGDHWFACFRMARVEFQVFPLTFDVVLITLWHYRASV